jgi:hypothetical protein
MSELSFLSYVLPNSLDEPFVPSILLNGIHGNLIPNIMVKKGKNKVKVKSGDF